MQLRVGPLYAGKIEGILQLIADGLKLISKEIIIPSGADKLIFWAAPIAYVATAAAVVALIPAGPGWVVANIDVGLLAVFAIRLLPYSSPGQVTASTRSSVDLELCTS
jgi:NADH-quinone oxidoreductase subunit H